METIAKLCPKSRGQDVSATPPWKECQGRIAGTCGDTAAAVFGKQQPAALTYLFGQQGAWCQTGLPGESNA